MSAGRTLPHNPDAERGLLGSIIADGDPNKPTLDEAITARITAKSFADQDHARVFCVMQQMRREGLPVEGWTLLEQLTKTGMERARAIAVIRDVTASAPTSAYFKSRLTDVLEAERRRSIVIAATAAAEAAFDPASDSEQIMAGLRLVTANDDKPSGLGFGTTAENLCQSPPAVPAELIAGVLYLGGTMMLSGPSKSRKTYTFIDLGLSVATGSDWLGFSTSKTAVIYLNFELSEHSFARRVAAICQAKGIKPPSTFRSYNLRGRCASMGMLSAELPRLIKAQGAGLVILDPWYKISAQSGAEENSNDAQARILAEAERIVTANGAALVNGHHFAKGEAAGKNSIDRAAGAGAMARWGDVIATLSEHEEADAMSLEMHLRDFAPVAPMALRWQHPLWVPASDLDPAKLKRAGRTDQHPASELWAKLTRPMTNKEWQDASGWTDGTFRRKRDELLKAGKVLSQTGVYRRA